MHQDIYSEQALHEPPRNGSGKRAKANGKTPSNGSAPPTSAPPKRARPAVPAVTQAAPDAPDGDEVREHQVLAPPIPAPRRPGLIPTEIADTIGPVLGKAIADIKAHEDGSRRGGDIEDVHKMRVATRRVRAYLKAARPALDRVATDRLRADVRELAGTLGVIRDNDVMIHQLHIEAGLLGDPDTGALEHLITRLDTERIAGRDRLISELDDPVVRGAVGRAERPPRCSRRWLTRGPTCTSWPPTSGGCWTRRIANCTGRSARTHRTTSCTNLRIYGKRARYAAELLHDKGAVSGFLAALAAFQEVLGNHQDACVLEDRLRELVEESGDARAGIAAGRVIQGCHERRIAARAAYPAAWKKAEAAGRKAFAG